LEDKVLPAEEEPLPAAVSPTTESPGYILEFDLEKDPEEDDDEDPKEDPVDYPVNEGDDGDDEAKPSEDDDVDIEADDDEEEEEHLDPADSTIIPSPPLPTSPTYPLRYRAVIIQLRAKAPSTSHPPPLPSPIVLPHTRASIAMMRAATPSTYCLAPRLETLPLGTPLLLPIPLPTSSPPLLLPSTDRRADIHSRADYGFVATLDDEIMQDPERDVGNGITDTWDAMLEGMPKVLVAEETELDHRMLSGRLNMLFRDRRAHARIARLIELEARMSRAAWSRSMDASSYACSGVMALRTQVYAQRSEIAELRATDRRKQMVVTEMLAADHRRQVQLTEALKLLKGLKTQMVELQRQQGPAKGPTQP
ncbi:hypothetical protein Tco_1296233, partial [Tanacetum coccineum]